mmetsp:Transcript_88633/g.194224  ORF Transcript_88633/g.194224 Transcript_88633/m.194224 type:complete len:162 (+) Transcript_88633:117-602(+)
MAGASLRRQIWAPRASILYCEPLGGKLRSARLDSTPLDSKPFLQNQSGPLWQPCTPDVQNTPSERPTLPVVRSFVPSFMRLLFVCCPYFPPTLCEWAIRSSVLLPLPFSGYFRTQPQTWLDRSEYHCCAWLLVAAAAAIAAVVPHHSVTIFVFQTRAMAQK